MIYVFWLVLSVSMLTVSPQCCHPTEHVCATRRFGSAGIAMRPCRSIRSPGNTYPHALAQSATATFSRSARGAEYASPIQLCGHTGVAPAAEPYSQRWRSGRRLTWLAHPPCPAREGLPGTRSGDTPPSRTLARLCARSQPRRGHRAVSQARRVAQPMLPRSPRTAPRPARRHQTPAPQAPCYRWVLRPRRL